MPRKEYEKEKGEELSLGITGYDLADQEFCEIAYMTYLKRGQYTINMYEQME